MQEELRALRGAERGTLALAASTTPGSYVLPSILQCFAERHPRVDVDVVIGSSAWVAERVARREVSLGLAGELELPDGVRGRAVPRRRDGRHRRARAARAARRAVAARTSWRAQTLLVREPGSSTRAVAERYLGARRLPARQALGARLQRGDQALGPAGLGIGFVSEPWSSRRSSSAASSCRFRIEGAAPMRRSVYLLRPDGREPTPSERAFIQTLCSCCAVSVAGCTVEPAT